MELRHRISPNMPKKEVTRQLLQIGKLIWRLADSDLFPWLEAKQSPSPAAIHRASTVVADRLCGAVADPIIRNAQEKRQFAATQQWLTQRGYKQVKSALVVKFSDMEPGTFALHLNVPVSLEDKRTRINISIDIAIMPKERGKKTLPVLIECKSAGDFTNTNKRRKEEAIKIAQLRSTYGKRLCFLLFLCGYFDSGYLGYEAAEGIDWVWEHRIGDLAKLGL